MIPDKGVAHNPRYLELSLLETFGRGCDTSDCCDTSDWSDTSDRSDMSDWSDRCCNNYRQYLKRPSAAAYSSASSAALAAISFSSRLRILPVGPLGNSLITSTIFGHLYFAMRS